MSYPQPHISYSQIKMYLRCPKQYEFRYVDGLKSPPSGALLLGSGFHKAVASNYIFKIENGFDMDVKDVADRAAAAVDETSQQDDYQYDEGDTLDTIRDEAVDLAVIHREKLAPSVRPMLVEHEEKIAIAPGLDLVSYIDLIEVGGHIADNKTARTAAQQAEVDKDAQLTTYALARSLGGHAVPSMSLDVVTKGKRASATRVMTTRTEQELDLHSRTIQGVINAVSAGGFPMNTDGWHCSKKWCGYWDKCVGKAKAGR